MLPLGDLQYDDGDLTDFEASYAKTWGKFESITRPVPGNHDYHVDGAEGYLTFFKKQTGGRSYYAFDIGDWRYYALDSNCSDIGLRRGGGLARPGHGREPPQVHRHRHAPPAVLLQLRAR